MNMCRRPIRKNNRVWSIRCGPKADTWSGLVTNASARTETVGSNCSGEYFSIAIAMKIHRVLSSSFWHTNRFKSPITELSATDRIAHVHTFTLIASLNYTHITKISTDNKIKPFHPFIPPTLEYLYSIQRLSCHSKNL